jgi:hypothetical protein
LPLQLSELAEHSKTIGLSPLCRNKQRFYGQSKKLREAVSKTKNSDCDAYRPAKSLAVQQFSPVDKNLNNKSTCSDEDCNLANNTEPPKFRGSLLLFTLSWMVLPGSESRV